MVIVLGTEEQKSRGRFIYKWGVHGLIAILGFFGG